ncbi:MAG: holo-ACP synthase [Subdoligranulum sp.]|nr:holo-ACP synthase [Subdoligranulum sp.]
MIVGIGVDMTRIERVEKSLARPGFLERVYGPGERALLEHMPRRAERAAANFAAKEAFGKALGTGLFRDFAPCEAEALRDERGAPYFAFSGRAAALMQSRGLQAHLSLTHEGGYAAAFVVLECVDGGENAERP